MDETDVEIQKALIAKLRRELADAELALLDIELALRKLQPACESFKWIGQSFKFCDDCGKPYWEHTHESRWVKGEGVVAVPISAESAAACRAKWDIS